MANSREVQWESLTILYIARSSREQYCGPTALTSPRLLTLGVAGTKRGKNQMDKLAISYLCGVMPGTHECSGITDLSTVVRVYDIEVTICDRYEMRTPIFDSLDSFNLNAGSCNFW